MRRVWAAASAAMVTTFVAARANPEQPACDTWEIQYETSGNLRLADTPMGAGNGIYRVGPGRIVLRVQTRPGRSVAELTSYDLHQRFEVDAKALFWRAHVTTDVTTRAAASGGCEAVARGTLLARRIEWTTPIAGYRTDGTLDCNGSLCGSFGAPPAGRSPLHIGPEIVRLNPFEFSPDMQTFTMRETFVSKTEKPQQTAYLTLTGREVQRKCLAAPPCP
jgi:hypothetical protein